MTVRVTITRKGKPGKRPRAVLGVDHMAEVGEDIARPLRENLANGLDADGQALAPEVRGDGIPGHETGALAASIKPRKTTAGALVVMPDYKRFRYGIFLATGVDTKATREAVAAGRMRQRREYKVVGERKQPPRPFMGIAPATLRVVARKNEERFAKWVAGALRTSATVGDDLPGAVR